MEPDRGTPPHGPDFSPPFFRATFLAEISACQKTTTVLDFQKCNKRADKKRRLIRNGIAEAGRVLGGGSDGGGGYCDEVTGCLHRSEAGKGRT